MEESQWEQEGNVTLRKRTSWPATRREMVPDGDQSVIFCVGADPKPYNAVGASTLTAR